LKRRIIIGVAGVLGFVALVSWRLLSRLTPASYLPHSFCYLAKPGLIWSNAVSDIVIAVSYVVLFTCLFYLAHRLRNNDAFREYLWILIGFGLFILACGATHAMETVTLWLPLYPLSTTLKIICAAVSVPTAVLFARTTPSLAGNVEQLLTSLAMARRETENEAAKYREQVEAIDRSQMMLDLAMDCTILKANANYLKAFGYKDFELTGKHHSIFVSEACRKSPEYEQFWRELRAGRYQSGQFCRFDKWGNEVWIEASYNPILDHRGIPQRVVEFASNVTDRVRIQKDLRRSRQILDRTGSIAHVGGWEIELSSGEVFWSGEMYRLVGMPEGKPPTIEEGLQLYPADVQPVIRAAIEKAVADRSGFVLDLPLIRPDGRQIWTRVTSTVECKADKPVRLIGALQDITDRVLEQSALREADNRVKLATESGGFGIWDYDIAKDTLTCDPLLFRLYGVTDWDKREIFSSDRDSSNRLTANHSMIVEPLLRSHIHPEDREAAQAALRESLENDKPYDTMFRVVWDDKSVHHLRAAGSVSRDENGRALRMLGGNWDVTELVEANQKSCQAVEMARESNRAKSDFVANMSHEIRTPMNAILGMTYLARRADPNPKLLDYLDKIGNAAQSLLGILNDILDFSKIEAGKLEMEVIDFSINDVWRNLLDVVEQKAQDKGIELLFSVADEVPSMLVGDPLRLGQILINLVNNAVKFTAVGKITIRVTAEDISSTELQLNISVSDTGIGMGPEQSRALFQPFHQGDTSYTRKYGGTGLGLAICKQLTELMGGKISAESELGKGSTFHFTAKFGIAREVESISHSARSIASQKSILIVDDSETTRHALLTMLESRGFRVRAVSSGEEALSALTRASQSGEPVDLVLLDWRLPGIDGLETSRRIKANPRLSQTTSLLMVSAFEREEVFAGKNDANFEGFLAKPVSEKQLLKAISRALDLNLELEANPPQAPASKLAGRHVLLVEDNEVNRFLAAELLSELGIVVTMAVNGREGTDRVFAEPFDMILMDIQMPIMDGLAATKLIRKDPRSQNLPIIAMTAHAMSGDRERSLAAGMNDHLTKPINPDSMAEMLTRWMPVEAARPGITEGQPSKATPPNSELPEQLPPFDLPAALARANGKPKLLRRMLLSFRDQFKSAASDLRKEIAEGKTEEAGRLAHSLKGVAATLEAKDLAEAAASIEHAIREGITQGLEALIARMQEALDPAITAADTVDRRTMPPSPAPDPQTCRTEMTILLVDDQSGYLDLLKDIFGSHAEVLYASDGPTALRIAAARVPDLILLDVMMAGMDGYEVFHHLHANGVTRDIPVIFLTGLGSVAEETKGLNMGAADYVTKPINPVVVRTRVTHQVAMRRTQQELMRKAAEEHAAELAREEARAEEIARLGQQALELRDDFLSHVSHELRSPLNSIYSFSSIIADGLAGKTTNEQDEYLLIILKNIRQLQAMIEDVLAVTASKNGKLSVVPKEISISEAILDAVHTCEASAREKGINLSCSTPLGLPSVYADPVRVLQVLTILCDNAIKFTPERGSVKVQVRMFDKVPGYLLVEVSDTGCGIKPEHLDQIFEHLYQVTDTLHNGRRGLGLGLHIARELMFRQGGSIWATSVQGTGSVFSVTLPVYAGQAAETPVPA
jgi:two-component system, sensor histidine kinase and response regulator